MEVLRDYQGSDWTLLWSVLLPGAPPRHLGHTADCLVSLKCTVDSVVRPPPAVLSPLPHLCVFFKIPLVAASSLEAFPDPLRHNHTILPIR